MTPGPLGGGMSSDNDADDKMKKAPKPMKKGITPNKARRNLK